MENIRHDPQPSLAYGCFSDRLQLPRRDERVHAERRAALIVSDSRGARARDVRSTLVQQTHFRQHRCCRARRTVVPLLVP
jgi:hypothetical protein